MNKPRIKIVIADDNKFFAAALKDSLKQHNEFTVIATLNTINDVINFTNNNTLDILILDVNFNGVSSLNYITVIKNSNSLFKIIALTTLNNNFIKREAEKKGIDFFVGKDTNLSNFKTKILDCFYGNITQIKTKTSTKITVKNLTFTRRKLYVLQELYTHSEKNESELSKVLNISESTLKSHKRELFEISNTKNTSELIRFGIKNGLIIV